jgi:hypothetical protein
LKALYIEFRTGSNVEDILERVKKFNNKHPFVAIDPETISRSIKQHMEQSAFMHNGVSLSPNLRLQLLDHMRHYKY